MNALNTAILLMLPLIFSGSLHMLIVARGWFSITAVPLQLTWFGRNKTWRGILVMLVLTIPGVMLTQSLEPYLPFVAQASLNGHNAILLGLALGLGYVLPELPNSYLKRRLNIQPGERSGRHTVLFSFIDQADSALGCALVYALLLSPPLAVLAWTVALGPLVHVIINLLLFSAGLRKQPF